MSEITKLNTRIISKHDTLTNLNNSTFKPYDGEIVFAKVDTYGVNGVVVPTYLMKVGDGEHKFSELKWVGAQALDVFSWAKQANFPVKKIGSGNVISNIEWVSAEDAATETDTTLRSGYLKLSTESVATSEALAGLAEDVGELSTAHSSDISRLEGLINGKSASDHTHATADLTDWTTVRNAITTEIGSAKTGAENTAHGELEAYKTTVSNTYATKESLTTGLAGKSNTGHTHVIDDVTDWSTERADIDADIATALAAGTGAQTTIDTYKTQHASDYTNTQIDTAISGAVGTEKERAESVEAGLTNRIGALEGQITGLTGAMHFKGVKDTLPTSTEGYAEGDVIAVGDIEYVFNGTQFVELGDVTAQGQRISTLEGTVGDASKGLVKSVADNAGAISKEVEDRVAADTAIKNTIGGSYTSASTVHAAIVAAKKAGDDAQAAINTFVGTTAPGTYVDKTTFKGHTDAFDAYKQTNDAAVAKKADTEAMTAALAGKSDTGHKHAIADVNGLQDALAGKSDTGHKHAIEDVNGLEARLAEAKKAGDDAQDAIDTFIETTAPDTYLTKGDFQIHAAVAVTKTADASYGSDATGHDVLSVGGKVIIFDCGTATINV